MGASHLVLGQIAALAMALTGVFTTELVKRDASVPLLQSLGAYVAIVCIFVPLHALRRWWVPLSWTSSPWTVGRGDCTSQPWWAYLRPTCFPLWRYALIGFFDLEANSLVVLAYAYTDITSVQLLDCATVPCVVALSWVFLRRRPLLHQVIGAAIALCGLAALIVFDSLNDTRSTPSPHPLLGDALCLVSSVCYAVSNVACETLLRSTPPPLPEEEALVGSNAPGPADAPPTPPTADAAALLEEGGDTAEGASFCRCTVTLAALSHRASVFDVGLEYITFMPLCAAVMAAVQLAAVGRGDLEAAAPHWDLTAVMAQCGFTAVMVGIYVLMPVLFAVASATFANLSLLTADIYAVVFNYAIFGVTPRLSFAVAFVFIVGGVAVYDNVLAVFCRRRRTSDARQVQDPDGTTVPTDRPVGPV